MPQGLSLYDVSVTIFIRQLTNLASLLKKANDHANASGMPHDQLFNARLREDMLPLSFQVQSCCNTSKNSYIRISGRPPIPIKDDEKTIEQLLTRIEETVAILNNADPRDFEGKELETVHLKMGDVDVKATAKDHLLEFALPNFFFHESIAYAILRHVGVPVGKKDFLGRQ